MAVQTSPAAPARPNLSPAVASSTPAAVPELPEVVPGRRLRADAPVTFPVVALGGSAGALEAYERFFRQLPATCGLAVVVVQHLLAEVPSALPEVLRGFTKLPVQEATDGLALQVNHVYVAPPGQELSLLHGTFVLLPPTLPAAQRLPIDFFFQSLAKDARERAVCVILSGAGSDGALGLKLVMENFGMVMVQDPATAACDSMPRAALTTEFVDFVLAPELMPAQLLDYVARLEQQRLPRRAARPPDAPPAGLQGVGTGEGQPVGARPAHALQKIFVLIRQQSGHDFSLYKRNTMLRRIERRMNSHQIQEFGHYVRYLQENPPEVALLFKELLIGVTKFFRDAEAFEALRGHLRELLSQRPAGTTIRVWAPGCSTGEETYSLAMLLHETAAELRPRHPLRFQLFATDLNPEGVDAARHGRYPANIEGDVSPARLLAYFTKTPGGGYQIKKELRQMVIFAVHNLNRDPPFTKLDLLVCRNLLIYLSAELQRNLLPVFHYALQPGGLLFLGPSESIGGLSELFTPLDAKWKIARRAELPVPLQPLSSFFPLSATLPSPATALTSAMHSPATTARPRREGGTFATLVQQRLLLHYAPPAVVVNAKGEIMFVHGRTGRYLEPAPGLGTLNLLDMAREGLNFELSTAVHRAAQERADVQLDGVRVQTDAGPQLLRLHVRYLREPDALAGLLLITFEDQPTPPRRARRPAGTAPAEPERDALVTALDKELSFTKHRLQTTIEEMEGGLEELKSTNEELQSANEELQSTNEETMTNKEEMQSLNEELMTLNLEYQTKSEELGQVAALDLKNLLDATEIAILFVDNELVIKRFTAAVARIINLAPGDEGRPLAHFAPSLRHSPLLAETRQVLDRLVAHESQIQTTAGEWFALRIVPYRTLDNYISGAIITFTEINQLKQLEGRLQTSVRLAEGIVAAAREPLLALDASLRVLALNPAFAALFALDAGAAQGQPLAALNGGAWQPPTLHQQLLSLLDPTGPTELNGLPPAADFESASPHRLRLYARRLPAAEDGQAAGVLLGLESGDGGRD
ncbi:CheR family methyltransferase [uncultured Hymenobacter sp.]|uniref:CheR family methyltransferase n=1 Tax=uncultured Hymenobacter sp. TaxID=170016 RepID=UPI0035CA0B62